MIPRTWRELDVFGYFVESPVVKEANLVTIPHLVLTRLIFHLFLGYIVLYSLEVLPKVIEGFKEYGLI